MKKFEMPEIQVVTFEEDIMALDIVSDPNGATGLIEGTTGNFTPDATQGTNGGWF